MGYEIWDRDAAALLADFDEEEQALAFLRDMVVGLDAEGTTRTIDRMQLVRVTDGGRTTTVLAEGVTLLTRMFAPALAR